MLGLASQKRAAPQGPTRDQAASPGAAGNPADEDSDQEERCRPSAAHAELPARAASLFRAFAPGGGLAAPSRRADRIRLDHLTDRRRANFEIHVCVRLDRHAPRRSDLQLLVDALEAPARSS